MTSPTSSTTSSPPSPAAFALCSGIVGSAIAIVLSWIMVRILTTDPSIGAVAACSFFSALVGGLTAMAFGGRIRERNPARSAMLAPVVYLLTMLAVPFLLYVTAVMLFLMSFASYQF